MTWVNECTDGYINEWHETHIQTKFGSYPIPAHIISYIQTLEILYIYPDSLPCKGLQGMDFLYFLKDIVRWAHNNYLVLINLNTAGVTGDQKQHTNL